MNAFFSFDLFIIYIPECTQQLRNNTRRLYIWVESSAIINDLEVILHGFMLLIIKTTVFRVKPVNSENRGINISYFHWHFHEIETFATAKTKRNRIITYIFRSKSEMFKWIIVDATCQISQDKLAFCFYCFL
jgi:hypothetical protein